MQICGHKLMPRNAACLHILRTGAREVARVAALCAFILLIANLPGFLGLFMFQLLLPLRCQPLSAVGGCLSILFGRHLLQQLWVCLRLPCSTACVAGEALRMGFILHARGDLNSVS